MIPPLESLLSICGARAEHPSCGERQARADRAKSLCRMLMRGRLLGVIYVLISDTYAPREELYLTPSPHKAMLDARNSTEKRQCHPL